MSKTVVISSSVVPTYTHVAVPRSSRCQWWQSIGKPQEVLALDPAGVESANDLPGEYLRKGTDLELPAWTVIFDGEANHHSKQRGWTHQLAIVAPDAEGDLDIKWVRPTADHKARIKARAPHLKGGSGPNAAMARIARFVLEGVDDADRLARWRYVRGVVPQVVDAVEPQVVH